jgi:hypothetical protein
VIDEHGRPRDRLERDPLQADRATKGENRQEPATATKHEYEARERAVSCQSGRALQG